MACGESRLVMLCCTLPCNWRTTHVNSAQGHTSNRCHALTSDRRVAAMLGAAPGTVIMRFMALHRAH